MSNVVNFSTGIGLLLIRGLDLSEKFYGVMTVRGYGGKISAAERKGKPGINNICIALIGLLIFTAGLVIRLGTGMQDISIFILVFSVLIFFVSVITVPRVRT